jgi:putative hydrolase of the HAD superfamily
LSCKRQAICLYRCFYFFEKQKTIGFLLALPYFRTNKYFAVMSPYKHIFWDLDHTLWDFETNSVAALQQVYTHFLLAEKGVEPFDAFNINYHKHNDVYWARFRKGFITREKMRWKRMYVTMMDYKIADENLAKQMGEAYLDFLAQQTNLFTL